jgi:hypothetical protein
MKTLSRNFRYLRYFLQAETKALRTEAFLAAKHYYAGKEKTPLEFQYFQRGYKNYICDKVALERLAQTSK